ncbi:MAG: hypothetical protein E7218_01455 [Anaerofustis stercorihominis]|nr:hypothetical protein [Anaerofustis stercorihominis]
MKVTVNPGPCKLQTIIIAQTNDDDEITVSIQSDCGAYKKMNEELQDMTFDAYSEIFTPFGTSEIAGIYKKYVKHATCPVLSAILKAIEAEANLALPQNVTFEFEK